MPAHMQTHTHTHTHLSSNYHSIIFYTQHMSTGFVGTKLFSHGHYNVLMIWLTVYTVCEAAQCHHQDSGC